MEVCVDCLLSARNAFKGGASRIELCSSLCLGGLTPSVGQNKEHTRCPSNCTKQRTGATGLLQSVKQHISIPVFVMIRPRADDFLYSDEDLDVMKNDIRILKQFGADGFVFGALDSNGKVDKKACAELLELCRPLPATFHRALDVTCDIKQALEDVIALGFERVLTSGGYTSAPKGAEVIRELKEQAKDRIIIMPGSGISELNLADLLKETKVKEFHGSASTRRQSGMIYQNPAVSFQPGDGSFECQNICSIDKVKVMVQIFKEYLER